MTTQHVTIGTGPVSMANLVAVARHGATVSLSADAEAAVERARAVVEELAEAATPAYGISTGFGALATRHIPTDLRARLQRSLVRSHAAGSGPEVEREVVRALMLLRLVDARDRSHRHPSGDGAAAGRTAEPWHHARRARVRLARLLGRPRAAVALRAGADGRGRRPRRRRRAPARSRRPRDRRTGTGGAGRQGGPGTDQRHRRHARHAGAGDRRPHGCCCVRRTSRRRCRSRHSSAPTGCSPPSCRRSGRIRGRPRRRPT